MNQLHIKSLEAIETLLGGMSDDEFIAEYSLTPSIK